MTLTFRDLLIDQEAERLEALIARHGEDCPRCGEGIGWDCNSGCEDPACALRMEPPSAPDARDPDHTRAGIFADHNCWKCNDGKKACANGNPSGCDYPIARND